MSQNIDPFPFTDSNWRGNVLVWDEHAIFIGLAAGASLHESPAIKICVALDGTFGLRTTEDDTFTNYDSAIIAPGQPHAIDGRHNKMAMLLLVPEAQLAQGMAPIYVYQGITRISGKTLAKVQRKFAYIEKQIKLADFTNRDLEVACDNIVAAISNRKLHAIDERILKGIELIRKRQNTGVYIDELAAHVDLSESRFSHLFTENVRISVRRYFLWLRLREAMDLIAGGRSLTETAHEAGFSDSAHLTRTFRGMLGITPSALIKESSIFAMVE